MRNPLPCVSRLECILKLLVVSLGLLCLLSVPGAAAAAPACPTYEALTALAARPALVRLAIKGNCPAPAQLTARVTRASGEALGVALLPPDRDGGFSVDLGRWLGGKYQIPGVERDESDEDAPPASESPHSGGR